jgi:integrase
MAGAPVHVVSRRLGHASAAITLNVYGHVLGDEAEREAAERAAASLAAARAAQPVPKR